jgi:uncharacterized protein YutE (UPF0331/DUF86 family)
LIREIRKEVKAMKEDVMKNLQGMTDRDMVNNILTAEIIDDYLEYCSTIVTTALTGRDNYAAQQAFKELGDELIITPEELVKLIDAIQVALENVDWSP